MDDKIKELLQELGNAINESISSSDLVNEQIQKIREHGYNLYVFLDATIGLGRDEEEAQAAVERSVEENQLPAAPRKGKRVQEVQFRINVNDLSFLRSVGIDPTRKVRTPKRTDGRKRNDEPSR